MKTIMILIGIAWSAAEGKTVEVDDAGAVVLENQVVQMEIGRTPAPFIQRLVHKANGRAVSGACSSKPVLNFFRP